VERRWTDQEIEALLAGAGRPPDGCEGLAGVLDDVRSELLRPVPAATAHHHLEAMLAVAPTASIAQRRPRRAAPRRALALVACVGATFAYGGLAAANMLPAAINVPHHVHVLFEGGQHSHELQSPTTGAAAPGNARGDTATSPTSPQRRESAPPIPLHPPGGRVRKPATTTTTIDPPTTTPPPGNRGDAPGHGATPPGHGGTPPGQGDTPSNGKGNDGSPPGQSVTTPGDGATPPGHGGTPPGQAVAPGQNGNTASNPSSPSKPANKQSQSAPGDGATNGKGNNDH
jgi:hypothetical protein